MSGTKGKCVLEKLIWEYAPLVLILVLAFIIIFPGAQYCRGLSVVEDKAEPNINRYKWEGAYYGATISGVIEDDFNRRAFHYTTYADEVSLDDIREAKGYDADAKVIITRMLYHRLPKYQMIGWKLLVWVTHILLTYCFAKGIASLLVWVSKVAEYLYNRNTR